MNASASPAIDPRPKPLLNLPPVPSSIDGMPDAWSVPDSDGLDLLVELLPDLAAVVDQYRADQQEATQARLDYDAANGTGLREAIAGAQNGQTKPLVQLIGAMPTMYADAHAKWGQAQRSRRQVTDAARGQAHAVDQAERSLARRLVDGYAAACLSAQDGNRGRGYELVDETDALVPVWRALRALDRWTSGQPWTRPAQNNMPKAAADARFCAVIAGVVHGEKWEGVLPYQLEIPAGVRLDLANAGQHLAREPKPARKPVWVTNDMLVAANMSAGIAERERQLDRDRERLDALL